MNVREQLVVVAVLSFAVTLGAGCKKNVDLSAFDAGATATAAPDTADAAVAAADTGDAAADADVEALTNAKTVHATAPKGSAKPAASAPAQPKSTGIPECDEAGRICSSVHGNATRVLCTNKTAECLKRGGHVPSQ